MSALDSLNCPHGSRCGGCAFLGVPYGEQLERKREQVSKSFARYPLLTQLRVANVDAAEPAVGYRARAKLVFDAQGALGLYERDSHAVVDIPECRVLLPALARVAEAARRELGRAGLDGLDLRVVDAGVLVTLIARRGTPHAQLLRFAEALQRACPDVHSVAASFREADAATVLGTGHVLLVGEALARHHLSEHGPYHYAAHGAFAQVHLGQAERAHVKIERALVELGATRVLELYAGSGALALRLASRGLEITAVEAFAPALAQAERAAQEQTLRLTTRSGSAESVLGSLKEQSFDAIIVNPPRRGLSESVRRSVAAFGPRAVLYMSCDPRTLARDTSHFRELGYLAQNVEPFDMIPHSEAVESLVVFERAARPEADLLQQSGYEHEASGVGVAGTRTFLALVRGITHKKGKIRELRYQREAIHGGHSLLRIRAELAPAGLVRKLLAGIGHPVLGDRRHGDAASNTFFEHRHGLDRSFLHVASVTAADATHDAELPGELTAVLASLAEQTAPPRR